MVKIRELSDKQLLAQIEKYEKIYNQLIAERDKRLDNKRDSSDLMTANEKKLQQQTGASSSSLSSPEKTQAFQLKFDDSDISQMEESVRESSEAASKEEEQDSVTQLLKISKEQLAELQSPKKKVVKKKKVLKKKG